ncbi:MAG: hypothetical protein ACJ75T_12360 [Solirubrobacterales bacterium]
MPPVLRDPVSRGLLGGYQACVALRQSLVERPGGDPGLPLPPPRMRVMVVGPTRPSFWTREHAT